MISDLIILRIRNGHKNATRCKFHVTPGHELHLTYSFSALSDNAVLEFDVYDHDKIGSDEFRKFISNDTVQQTSEQTSMAVGYAKFEVASMKANVNSHMEVSLPLGPRPDTKPKVAQLITGTLQITVDVPPWVQFPHLAVHFAELIRLIQTVLDPKELEHLKSLVFQGN